MNTTAGFARSTVAAWGRQGGLAASRLLDPAPLLARFHGASGRAIAVELGCSRRQVCYMRAGQRLSRRNADRYATALGLHSSAIW